MKQTIARTCPLCEAMCGLDVTIDDGEVLAIRGRKSDVWSRGHLCPKGTTLGKLHADPDRLRGPKLRIGDRLVDANWDDALSRTEELLRMVIDADGVEAVGAYVGNPAGHNYSLSRYVGRMLAVSGIRSIYSAGTVDQWPKHVSCALMYGDMFAIPVPDIERTSFLVVLGANPQSSQGSLLSCPDIMGEIGKIRRRGGRVVVVDPRRTGTADRADEWLPIRPGTDAAFLLAVVHVLFADGLVDLGAIDDLVEGTSEVAAAAGFFAPDVVSGWCGISAARIRQLAHEIAAADRAAVYGRMGISAQEFGTLASWLVDVVNILTGNFDVPGGVMFPEPVAWSIRTPPGRPKPSQYEFGRWRSRVRGAPEVFGQVPASCLAEEIDTPGPGQLKALITVAGNPVLSTPNATRLRLALPRLRAMISIDNWVNETTCHADVILPGPSPLEQPHFDDLYWLFAVRSAAKWSPAVLPNPGLRDEWEVLLRIAAVCCGRPNTTAEAEALDDEYFGELVAAAGLDPAAIARYYSGHGPDRIVDLTIRSGPWGDRYGLNPGGLTIEALQASPDGIEFGPMRSRLREVLRTPSGRVEVAPKYILGDLARLRAKMTTPPPPLLLIGRRHLRSNNSWMHNLPVLVSGTNRCTLMIHEQDATRHNLKHGDLATVSTASGSVDVEIEVTDEMSPGVVSLPHGWGHERLGTQQHAASDRPGVNANILSPGESVDALSGNAAVNGIPVTVTPTANGNELPSTPASDLAGFTPRTA